jgi:hypothetical protein
MSPMETVPVFLLWQVTTRASVAAEAFLVEKELPVLYMAVSLFSRFVFGKAAHGHAE